MILSILPTTLQLILSSFLFSEPISHIKPPTLNFQPRHEYGLAESRPVFADIKPSAQFASQTFSVHTQALKTHRPKSQAAFSSARFNDAALRDLRWEEAELMGPDVHHRETLQHLAKMTNNAYSNPGEKDWYDLGPDWNNTYPFGWEPDADGFRGQVFVNEDNSTVVISIKGTSAGWIVGGGGPTAKKDKLNDNLLFSCCCARVGPTWRTVCGCYEGGYKCDQNCLEKSLVEDSLFYPIGTNLYNNVTYMYPKAEIWVIGHSLGGSLASLLGVTFGVPVVAFEAPGEKLASRRLHLPSPPSTQHITHIYHTADPIAMGTCNGVSSSCAIAGYAMETGCHLGKVIRYDTVSKLGWAVDVRTHGIAVVVEKLLDSDWEVDEEEQDEDGKTGRKRTVPRVIDEEDCVDCFSWEYGEFRNA